MRKPLCFLAALALMASACSNTWPGPVPIDEALWDIEVSSCGPVDNVSFLMARGTVTNTGNEQSPFYETASRAVFTDGTLGESNYGTLIPPLEPGQSYEFDFALSDSADKEVTTCEVWIVDAVENYRD